MKIYDCFMFSDEKMILDIRLNVLNEYVDHFVIVESKYKHNGDIKNKKFDINEFSKFKNKIIYIYQDHEPKDLVPTNNNNESRQNRSLQRKCRISTLWGWGDRWCNKYYYQPGNI